MGLLVVLLAACGDDDGGMDAAVDAGTDATEMDAQVDATSDAGTDAEDPDAGPPPEVEVTYDHGTVVGRTIDGVDFFLALPYAAPPVGDMRWRAPGPVTPWDEPRDAGERPENCAQIDILAAATEPSGSEDCLYLNVFSPDSTATNLPVLFFIHGGAFVAGSGGRSAYVLARETNTVVVTINYRLDQFGFLAHEALAAEGGGTGNYGLLDQRAAMQWVRDHIDAFGGDPNNVAISGESAGAVSVALHGISPGSDGLFDRAIVQSGPPHLLPMPTLEEAQAIGEVYATGVGCDDVDTAAACLRALSVDEVLQPTPIRTEPGGLFYAPVVAVTIPNVDGVTILEDPTVAYAEGRFSDVPWLIGSNGDEGTLFHSDTLSTPIDDTEEAYRAALANRYPNAEDIDAIVARYPVASFDDANRALAEVTGDHFNCMTRQLARWLADNEATTYLYAFEAVPDGLFVESLGLGAFHAADLVFLWDLDDTILGKVADEDQDLRDAMQRYWTRFTANGDPNGDGDPTWPVFETESDEHMTLATPPTAGSGYLEAECDFWDGIEVGSAFTP